MMNITYGEAKISNSLRISILLKTAYIQTYAVDGITFEFANLITEKFSDEQIKKNIKENPPRLIVAYYDNNPVGVADIIFNSNCPIRNIPVPQLGKLYVLEKFFGKGIGYGLINEAEKKVLQNGFNSFNLEVYINNSKAIAFYKRQGYTSIGSVNLPLETNTYENLIMNKVL